RLFATNPVPDGNLVPYVFRCVRHAAVDIRRRQAADGRLQESLFRSSSAGTPSENEQHGAEDMEQLGAAIDRLDDDTREVIVLKSFCGFTFDQISLILESPDGTVRSRYRRGLKKLEESLRGMS
ncbi:MAG: sigma-70 family RNA polymerase sigma factor, partial [Planctomycetaceae bacterium]|nr:sigma-70 family RNA polymerase sigma factor [Planctomycetaceae bacterium]